MAGYQASPSSEPSLAAPALSVAAVAPFGWRRTLRVCAAALAYVGAFLLLDWLSEFHSVEGTEITPWGPGSAMMIAVVMRYGLRMAPLSVLTPWLSVILLWHRDPLSLPALAALLCVGVTYTAAGLWLRRLLRDAGIESVRGIALLLITVAASALANATLYTAALSVSGHLSPGSLSAALGTQWVGDVNAIVILLPLVLLTQTRDGFPLGQVRERAGELVLQGLALAGAFWLVFGWSRANHLQLFYLFFLPIIWIALRWGAGMTVLALALLQTAIVVLLTDQYAPAPFVAIQLLMVVLAGTSLLMGTVVSSNARYAKFKQATDAHLAQLNRSTSISELNSSIAHELNNPLAALLNYLRSAQIVLAKPDHDPALLQGVLDKALAEGARSVDVLRKLRAFYRSGIVQPQAVDSGKLVQECIAAVEPKFKRLRISYTAQVSPELPAVSADPLQLAVVLQNLLLNACEAISAADADADADSDSGKVTLTLRRNRACVEFRVQDSGAGVPAAVIATLFRPTLSTKPDGMGLGLAICRSLVEANGGRIWLEHTSPTGACVAFSIPIDESADHEEP